MFQFADALQFIAKEIINSLTSANALEVLLLAEKLDLKEMQVRARFVALTEFTAVRKTRSFLESGVKWLCRFLSDVNLWCESEIDVFEGSMSWWNHNSNKILLEDAEDTLFALLTCMNFKALSCADVDMIKNHAVVRQFASIVEVLRLVADAKENEAVIPQGSKADIMMNAKARQRESCPGFVVDFAEAKKMNIVDDTDAKLDEEDKLLVLCDKKMEVVTDISWMRESENCEVFGYKQFVFVFERVNMWRIYDTNKQRWCSQIV